MAKNINLTACADFPNVVTQRHIFGGAHPGGAMTPKFELGPDFCTAHLPPSFTILCLLVRKLSCWQTNKQTNRRRWKHPTFFATLRRWVNAVLSYDYSTSCMNIQWRDYANEQRRPEKDCWIIAVDVTSGPLADAMFPQHAGGVASDRLRTLRTVWTTASTQSIAFRHWILCTHNTKHSLFSNEHP